MPFGAQDRTDRLARLESDVFDLLIVGGGITGLATARDAAMRGFKAACVEMEDFAYGTSSRSSKLIHGGLRYLEQANFRLVFEGTQERATLRKVAPHLVRPIQFLVPVYEKSKHGVLTLGVGLWMYDQLAGKRRYGRHSRHKPDALLKREPTLNPEGLRGGAIYYDCMTDDARLCVENAVGAHELGAVVVNRAKFLEPTRDEAGKVTGGVILDRLTGRKITAKSRVVVHCAGPWTDQVLSAGGATKSMIRTSKGVHLVLPHETLPVSHAVVMAAVSDRRVVFAIPRGRTTIIGTTDTDYDGDPDEVHTTSEDVDYLLETVSEYFPDRNIGRGDIRATYAGLRPLVRDDSDSPYDVSREHTVVTHDDGRITIGGGKLTTYRRMANDVVKAAMKVLEIPRKERPACPTADAPLPGAVGFSLEVDWAEAQARAHAAPDDIAEWQLATYGTRGDGMTGAQRLIEGQPYTWEQVDHAVQNEAALTIADVLVRRIPVFYEAPDQGLEVVEAVAARMAGALGWDADEVLVQIDAYRAVVALSRRWKGS